MIKKMYYLHQRCLLNGAILLLWTIMLICATPLIPMEKGTVNLKEPFYKNEEVIPVDTYKWSEILVEKQRFEIPKTYRKDNSTYIYNGFKSYENTKKITYEKAGAINGVSTNINGFQMLNNRYLVAVGTKFNLQIGQYFDLILENGTTIPCIMGDTKANKDTDDSKTMTIYSGCVSEFIVNPNKLPKQISQHGDVSKFINEWESPVAEIIVYENIWNK